MFSDHECCHMTYNVGAFNPHYLALIKWKDEEGQTQRFYLMDKISNKWRDIGHLLGLSISRLDCVSTQHRENPAACCETVLHDWLDNPPPEYPISWEGLVELLEDSKLSQVAAELRNALLKAKLISV